MKRCLGMMPVEKVALQESYTDTSGEKVTIQAGQNGWAILFEDSSSELCDETIDFNKAYDIANESIGPLTKIPCVNEVEEVICENIVKPK